MFSQLYLQLDLFFMARDINDDISDNIIIKGDSEYKKIRYSLEYNEKYKFMISRVIPNFDEKLKSFLLLKTTDMDNENLPLTDKDIAFIGGYLNYHDIPFSEEIYRLKEVFTSILSKIEINAVDIGSAMSDSSSDQDLVTADSRKAEAYFYLVLKNPHLNAVTYEIVKNFDENNE